MIKKNEVLQTTNTVIEKGNDFLGKAKDFIACLELLLVAATGFKSILEKPTISLANKLLTIKAVGIIYSLRLLKL